MLEVLMKIRRGRKKNKKEKQNDPARVPLSLLNVCDSCVEKMKEKTKKPKQNRMLVTENNVK